MKHMNTIKDKLIKIIEESFSQQENVSHIDKRFFYKEFINVFFNVRNTDNTALMLGFHNSKLVDQLLGTPSKDIINDNARYLISIHRDIPRVTITFDNTKYEDSYKRSIERLFNYYSSLGNVDLQLQLKDKRIPLLIIEGEEKVKEFLGTPLVDFSTLSSVISKIDISYVYYYNEDEKGKSIDTLFIIPEQCDIIRKTYVEESTKDPSEKNIKAQFKEAVSHMENTTISLTSFNFVLLNSWDNLIVDIFYELYNKYCEKYKLNETNTSLLQRIFVKELEASIEEISEVSPRLKETAGFMELLGTLHESLAPIWDTSHTRNLIIYLLDILHRDSVNGDTNKKILKYWDEYCEVIANKDTLNHLVTDLEESIRLLPELFLEAKSKTEGLINFLNNPPKKATKEDCFRLVDDFLLYIADYAIRYNDKANKDIAGFKERIESLKAEYELNKKKWYKNADSSFGKFCNSIAEDVNLIWNQTMTGLSLSDWWSQSIAKLEKAYDSYLHFVVNQSEDSNPSIKVLSSLNGQVVRYIYALKDLQDNVLKMYDAVKDSDDFIRSEFAESLLVYTSKAQDVLGEECENYSKELSNFISDNAIRVQMQDLLFGELKRIV